MLTNNVLVSVWFLEDPDGTLMADDVNLEMAISSLGLYVQLRNDAVTT